MRNKHSTGPAPCQGLVSGLSATCNSAPAPFAQACEWAINPAWVRRELLLKIPLPLAFWPIGPAIEFPHTPEQPMQHPSTPTDQDLQIPALIGHLAPRLRSQLAEPRRWRPDDSLLRLRRRRTQCHDLTGGHQ